MRQIVTKLQKGKLLLFLSLLAFTLIYNCSDENSQTETASVDLNVSPFRVYKIEYQHLEDNQLLMDKLRQIKLPNEPEVATESAKTIYLPEYGFYIDTDTANYLVATEGNYHSYTFNILQNDQNSLDAMNLLLSYNNEKQDYDAYVVTYNITPQERIQLSKNGYVDLTGKTSLTYLSNFNSGDVFDSLVIYIDDSSGSVTCWEAIYETSQATGWEGAIIGYTQVICPWLEDEDGGGGTGNENTGNTGNVPSGYESNTITGEGEFNGGHSGGGSGTGPTSASSILTLEQQRKVSFNKTSLNFAQKKLDGKQQPSKPTDNCLSGKPY